MEYTNDRISLPGRKRKQNEFQPNREDIKTAISKFIKKGGTITKKDYRPSLHELKGNYESANAANLSALI